MTAPPAIVINEIHYNAANDGPDFLELFNAEGADVEISGWTFGGFTFTVPDGTTIAAGDYFVVTEDLAVFEQLYPGVAALEWTGGALSGGGETITVVTDSGAVADEVTYDDGSPDDPEDVFPNEPDGNGPSLELIDPALDNGLPESWEVGPFGGTPGAANDLVVEDAPAIVINEIHYNAANDGPDFLELFNAEGADVEISGWTFGGFTFTVPDGTTIAAGDYFVVTEDLAVFEQLYPGVAALEWTGGALSGGGETITVVTDSGAVADEVTYDDGSPDDPEDVFPNEPDGNGPSLELIDPALDNDLPESWKVSDAFGGSPGAANELVDVTDPVVSDVTPADGDVVSEGLLDISGTVTDSESGVNRVRVVVRRLDGPTIEFWNGSDWVATYSVNSAVLDGADGFALAGVPVVAGGEYRLSVWAFDNAGNLSTVVESGGVRDFSVPANDVTDPVVSDVTPADGDVVSEGLLDISGTVTDSESGVNRVRVVVRRLDGPTIEFWNGSDWVATYSVNSAVLDGADGFALAGVPVVAGGEYRLSVWAFDNAGNLSTVVESGGVRNFSAS